MMMMMMMIVHDHDDSSGWYNSNDVNDGLSCYIFFSVVCVSKTKEARERVSSVEHLYVDHTDCRQWSADVYVQHGMVC